MIFFYNTNHVFLLSEIRILPLTIEEIRILSFGKSTRFLLQTIYQKGIVFKLFTRESVFICIAPEAGAQFNGADM